MKQIMSSIVTVLKSAPKMAMGMLVMSFLTINAAAQTAVLDVQRSKKQVQVVVANDSNKVDTITYVKTRNNAVSFEQKRSFVNGESYAFDNKNKDAEGNRLSRPFLGIGGGASYLFDGNELRPTLNAVIGWEKKNMILFADFSMSWKGYNVSSSTTDNGVTEGAEAEGQYNTFGACANIGWKLWQSDRYRSYVAPFAGAGYGYCKTDGDADDVRYTSSFYGLVWQAGVMTKIGFSRHFGLGLNLHVGNAARNYHDSEQDMSAIKLGAVANLIYTF
jgi:outer membrane protein W